MWSVIFLVPCSFKKDQGNGWYCVIVCLCFSNGSILSSFHRFRPFCYIPYIFAAKMTTWIKSAQIRFFSPGYFHTDIIIMSPVRVLNTSKRKSSFASFHRFHSAHFPQFLGFISTKEPWNSETGSLTQVISRNIIIHNYYSQQERTVRWTNHNSLQ